MDFSCFLLMLQSVGLGAKNIYITLAASGPSPGEITITQSLRYEFLARALRMQDRASCLGCGVRIPRHDDREADSR